MTMRDRLTTRGSKEALRSWDDLSPGVVRRVHPASKSVEILWRPWRGVDGVGTGRVLPNLEVVAIGAELEHGDRLALDCYAERTSDVVWKLEATKLLSATEEGRTIDEIRQFSSARSGAPLPETVMRLLEDVADRSARIQDHGLARLVECDEPALAALIANDTRTRRHCMHAGERHLVVPAASEAAFRRGLRELGYLVAHGHARARATTRPTATDVAGRPAAEA
jgi:Helicase conserved C-terminal domain